MTSSEDHSLGVSKGQKGIKDKISHTAYLLEVKMEFDRISDEFLEIRNLVKMECMDKSTVCHKLRMFEEFRIVFLE